MIKYNLIVSIILTVTIICALSVFFVLNAAMGLTIGLLSGCVCAHYEREIMIVIYQIEDWASKRS